MRRLIAAVAAVLAAGVVPGCGVPAEKEPHPVDLPRRPLNAVSPNPADVSPGGEVAEVLCLVGEGRIRQVVRRVEQSPTVRTQLEDLVAGPTAAEQARGMTTALAGLTVTVRMAAGGRAVVEVTEPDESSARSDEILAYAQIVCSLTARADVSSVSFTRDGEPIEVPRGDGSLTAEPLHSRDYATLIGPG